MKKLILLGAILFTLGSTLNAQLLIGKVVNGKPVLTIDKNKLLTTYNANLLKASNIDGRFTDANIVSNESNQYFLVFKGAKYKSSFSVHLKGEDFFVLQADLGISCTTSDCANEPNGCVPVETSCTNCANGGKCTKTISQQSLLE